jgi:hypothetical protein
MSMDGHTWVSLGTCDDGSVVILHSTPSMSRSGQPGGGVQISALGPDENCDAYALADEYMQKYFTWFERYPACVRDPAAYFAFEDEDGGAFTWDTEGDEGLTDPDGLQNMGPKEVLELLFAGME